MEIKYIWILTNHEGVFIMACENRDKAIDAMTKWRDNIIKIGCSFEVTRLSCVYADEISFEVKDRQGKSKKMTARKIIVC